MESLNWKSKKRPRRFLLVEDDRIVACKIQIALAVDGHLVDIAGTAEAGLELFETGEYDLVLADFKLSGMDGLEMAEAIRRRRPKQPIILITAYAATIDGEVSNIDILLKKPVSVSELEKAINQLLPAPVEAGGPRQGTIPPGRA